MDGGRRGGTAVRRRHGRAPGRPRTLGMSGPPRTPGAPGPSTGPARRRPLAVAVLCSLVAPVGLAACGSPGGSGTAHAAGVYRWGVVGNHGKIAQLERSTPTPVGGIDGKVVQIATSNSDGYALTSSGAVYAWGVNSYGELGDGHPTPYETRAVEVAFPADVRITKLPNPMPFDAGMAIDSSGHVWGWGLDADHDLCLAGLVESRPQRLPLRDVTLAAGARTHALVDSGGTVYACGSGDAGELGNGSTATVTTPTPVVGLPRGEKVTALTSSWEGSGALLAGGTYYDWGYNAAGQLGDGTTTDSAVPVKVRLPGAVTEVFQGGSGPRNGQTVALLRDGSTWTWGDNDRGQLGTGSRESSPTPVRVHVPGGVTFAKVGSGGYASYAIDTTGRLWAWGDNGDGQLGTGSGSHIETLPVDVGLHLDQVSSTAQNVAGLGTG
jgi:alpha-tubulin suppressor-like RCC1 family protein